MNIVGTGNKYVVYGEEVQTYKSLPINTYRIDFNDLTGFSLVIHNDLEVQEKVYGTYVKKVDKVMNTFKALNRNMGIILSGPKGVGKSIFARVLAEKGKKENLPLIIVDRAIPGVENFLESIQQECIVLFDEFEKVFKENEDCGINSQESLLSLFDGIDNGKKLFVITCNEIRHLNKYLLNRPGRFHYHFMLGTLTGQEVREYMEDNLVGEARQWINKVVALSNTSSFTYDILRAIAFELNQGYDLTETMFDLNIEREQYLDLEVKVRFKNGLIGKTSSPININMFNNYYNSVWLDFNKYDIPFEFRKYCSYIQARFYTRDIVTDDNGYRIDLNKVVTEFPDDWEYLERDSEEQKKYYKDIKDFTKQFEPVEITLTKATDTKNSYLINKFLV